MIFKGDLSRYHPADILMFLSHLNSNGILSIIHNDLAITVSFKNGKVADAYSARADEKVLRIFFFRKFINESQLKRLNQLKQETGMSISLILDELKIKKTAAIREILECGIRETLLEYFLLEKGNFNFTDVVIDVDPEAPLYDCQSVALATATQMDEWREIEKNLFSLESRIYPATATPDENMLTAMEKAVIGMADHNRSIRNVVQLMPCLSHTGLKVVQDLYNRNLIRLIPPVEAILEQSDEATQDELFLEFKRAFKKILFSNDTESRLSALTAYCKNYFEEILTFKFRELEVLECSHLKVEKDGAVRQETMQSPYVRMDRDAAFHTVYRSGISYLGNTYDSPLVKDLIDLPDNGECAIIPVGMHQDIAVMLYVVHVGQKNGLGAFHYLELLSWLFSPSAMKLSENTLAAGSGEGGGRQPGAAAKSPSQGADRSAILQLVEKIEELPPMPALVFRILDLLANPDFSMEDLERLIGRDQSLVANLIKVSNSVLYGGVGTVHSLRDALTRLGSRTIKSLVLIHSTRTFFPEAKSGLGSSSRLLWHHSVECGLASQHLAGMLRHGDPSEAFVGGILHDIGKLVVLLQLPEKYRRIQAICHAENADELEIESKILGSDHAAIGEMLMKKWKMPANLRECVQFHHQVRIVNTENLLVPIVACGNWLSHIHSEHAEIRKVKPPEETDFLVERLRLTPQQMETLGKELKESFQNNNVFD